MTGNVKILNGGGHTEVAWDTDVPESVEVARHEFDKAIESGMQPFDTSGASGGVALKKREFSTDVESVTFVPRMAGG